MEPRNELARLIAGGVDEQTGSGQLAVDLSSLSIHLDGYGPLTLPISAAKAKKLCQMGTPAPFGKGEETLQDTGVRDTWQLPIERVQIDWGSTRGGDAHEALREAARAALHLPPSSKVRVEPHSMLVYERGQFFAPHQDSEKADDMIASLVVILPSAFSGGELVVHDGRVPSSYQGSRTEATAIVFYADRLHEIKPVRTGHRVTLTFNVFVDGGTPPTADSGDLVAELTELLMRHFNTAPPSRYRGYEPEKPIRLAYLLDHQYTQRSLTWSRLKGVDVDRAGLLEQAAKAADCNIAVGLVDIQETWEPNWEDVPRGRGRWGGEYYDEVDDEDAAEMDVSYLLDSSVQLTHWRYPLAQRMEPVTLFLSDDEVCASTANKALKPYEAQYEGFMGNYGNTLDRWYRRAVILLWPRRLRFLNLATVSSQWAVDDLFARLTKGGDDAVPGDIATLAQLWSRGADASLLPTSLKVAALLDDPADATTTLQNFDVTALSASAAKTLLKAASRHGDGWAGAVVGSWFDRGIRQAFVVDSPWFLSLPDIVAAVQESPAMRKALVAGCWAALRPRLDGLTTPPVTPSAAALLVRQTPVLAAVLKAVAIADDTRVRGEIREVLADRPAGAPLVVSVLREAEAWNAEERRAAGLPELAEDAVVALQQRITEPLRAENDWSIPPPTGCGCADCDRLGEFLSDGSTQRLNWPLAKDRRQHLHIVIDRAELPVTHITQRSGRPFTLVLTKTAELHGRERRARRDDEQAFIDVARYRAAFSGKDADRGQ